MVTVEYFIKTVIDHQIGNLRIRHAHAVTPARFRHGKRRVAHIFHPSGDNDFRLPRHNRLRRQRNGFKPRGAYFIHRVGVGLLRQSGINTSLARDVLPLPRLQDIAHDDFIYVYRLKRRLIIVIFFVYLGHFKFAQSVRPAAFNKIVYRRPQPRAPERFFNNKRS